MEPAFWLPAAFAVLMGASILAYVVLDGYDLGVGLLTVLVDRPDKDKMIASIGPFWDANETWLVLAIGLLLVAFPAAHGMILTALYLPVALMLLGLILRGVAFDFRVKAVDHHKPWWDRAFFIGSALTALMQGYMLGFYVMGFREGWLVQVFAVLSALCLASAYAFIGAAWTILKTEGELHARAVAWARMTLIVTTLGILAISAATPLVSERIFSRWFSYPTILALAPVPIITGAIVYGLWVFLGRMPREDHRLDFVPFASAIALFVLAFGGLAYSFYPFVVPERLTIWQAASAPESLFIIFVGTCVVLPMIIAYSAIAYVVFRGKVTELRYD